MQRPLLIGLTLALMASNAADPSALPVGVRVLDHDGAAVGSLHDCPDLHGEASSGAETHRALFHGR